MNKHSTDSVLNIRTVDRGKHLGGYHARIFTLPHKARSHQGIWQLTSGTLQRSTARHKAQHPAVRTARSRLDSVWAMVFTVKEGWEEEEKHRFFSLYSLLPFSRIGPAFLFLYSLFFLLLPPGCSPLFRFFVPVPSTCRDPHLPLLHYIIPLSSPVHQQYPYSPLSASPPLHSTNRINSSTVP